MGDEIYPLPPLQNTEKKNVLTPNNECSLKNVNLHEMKVNLKFKFTFSV